MKDDEIRKAFEEHKNIPTNVAWSDSWNQYIGIGGNAMVADLYNEAYQDYLSGAESCQKEIDNLTKSRDSFKHKFLDAVKTCNDLQAENKQLLEQINSMEAKNE